MAPTLVLLHGFTRTGRSWDAVRAALGERYRSLAPDLRGHGTAGSARPISFPHVTADVLALVGGRFSLCGYSMGGRIALHVALADPDRVERLVLVGATAGIRDREEREARRLADEERASELDSEGLEPWLERWEAQPLLGAHPPDAARIDRRRNEPAGLAAALRGIGTGAMWPLWPRLPRLTMPVDLVVGAHDEKFQAIAGELRDALPRARLHVIPGAGHAVADEAPEALAAILTGE